MTQSSLRNMAQFYAEPYSVYFSLRILIEEDVMNNEEEIIQAIRTGLVVDTFLLNIGHALKAIELCKENLVLLSNKVLSIEKQLGQFIYKKAVYSTMFEAYRRVSDHINTIECGRKLLAIYRECGDTFEEGFHSIALAQIYGRQSMYAETKQLLEREQSQSYKRLVTEKKKQLLLES